MTPQTPALDLQGFGRQPVYIDRDGVEHDLPTLRAFLNSRARRRVLVVHRRGRKTSTSLEEVFRYLLVNDGIIGKTLAPTRKQAKEIIWDDPDMLSTILPKSLIAKKNETNLMITLKNGSIWYLDGADDPEHGKRGGNVKVLHLTEAGDHDPAIWSHIYEPVLTANDGIAIFEGNPRGRNWFYNLYMEAATRPGWERFLSSAEDTPIFTKAQLADLRASNPENVFNAEYLCRWVDSAGVVFRTFDSLVTAKQSQAQYNRKYRIGIDIAQMQDYTVLSVVDRHTWHQVNHDRFNQLSFAVIKKRIQAMILAYSARSNGNAVEVVIEINNQGKNVMEDLVAWAMSDEVMKTHEIIIRPLTTTAQNKSLLVSNFSMLCDLSAIRLLPVDIQTTELGVFTYKKNNTGFSYSAPSGQHDDCVMSLLLSYWELGGKYPLPLSPHEEHGTIKHTWGFSPAEWESHHKTAREREDSAAMSPWLTIM